jgi:hypothetical protein
MQPSVLGSCHIFETPSVIFADTTRLCPHCHNFFLYICTCLLMSHSRVLYVHDPSCHLSLIQSVIGSFSHVIMVLCVYWCHCRSLLILFIIGSSCLFFLVLSLCRIPLPQFLNIIDELSPPVTYSWYYLYFDSYCQRFEILSMCVASPWLAFPGVLLVIWRDVLLVCQHGAI